MFYLSSYIEGDNYKKIIIYSILGIGAIQCVYAILQIYDVKHIYRMVHTRATKEMTSTGLRNIKEIWATGFITNPNFFGSYMVLCVAYSLGLYLNEKNIRKKIVFIFFSALFIVGVLISNTTSCALATVIALIGLIVHCIRNKNYKEIITIIVVAISMTVLVSSLGKTSLIGDSKIAGQEGAEIVKGNSQTTFGNNRFYIWKNVFKIVPDNIINGVGIDNFYYAFDGKALVTEHGDVFYDKVHNEYLQILIAEGLPCLLAYLAFIFFICLRGFKDYLKTNKVFLLLPILAYLIQAFFNISVIEVAPFFYIGLGLCATAGTDNNQKIEKENKK